MTPLQGAILLFCMGSIMVSLIAISIAVWKIAMKFSPTERNRP